MGKWHFKVVESGSAGTELRQSILSVFASEFQSAGNPIEMAIFLREPVGEALVIYFSPLATELARTYAAEQCEKPTPDEYFVLLAGTASSWDVHFPKHSLSSRC